ncbi:MAG TPA: hypothetical protein VFC02_27605 [Anaerolineales bacterium]|nr:hypothetical protein [Anaerolineales bacterium]
MASIENYTDTVIHAFAHASTGTIVGRLVDKCFPDHVSDKSIARTAIELVLQFGIGFFAMSELMQLLTPNNEYYRPAIGDGTAVYWYFRSQPNFGRKFEHLVAFAENAIRKEILYLSRSSVQPATPTQTSEDHKDSIATTNRYRHQTLPHVGG